MGNQQECSRRVEAQDAVTRILLSGSTGFVGARLKAELVGRGHDLVCVVRPFSGLELGPCEAWGDIMDYDRLIQIVEGHRPEAVIHLAAMTPVRESFIQPLLYQQVNLIGTVNLVHACMKVMGNDFKLIFASTAEVYGENGEEVKREGQKLMPMSPYAVSKAAGDIYVRMCGVAYGLDYVLLRCNNTYGRIYSGYFVESKMEKLIKNELCEFYYPNSSRDYMWVDDHVNAYLTVLEKGYGVYNVSPGELITNMAMVRLMKKVVGSESEIKVIPPPPTRPTDHTGINMDCSLIRNLGWKPETSRIEGIKKLREMYPE